MVRKIKLNRTTKTYTLSNPSEEIAKFNVSLHLIDTFCVYFSSTSFFPSS